MAQQNLDQFMIPKHLDDPPMFLMIEADVATIALLVIGIGMVLQQMFAGILVGIIVARQYSRIKMHGGRGMIIQFMYWYTPSRIWLKATPPSAVRQFWG